MPLLYFRCFDLVPNLQVIRSNRLQRAVRCILEPSSVAMYPSAQGKIKINLMPTMVRKIAQIVRDRKRDNAMVIVVSTVEYERSWFRSDRGG